MKIQAQNRVISGKKVKNLRAEGIVPASVYGPKRKSTNIQIDKKEFIKLFKEAGFNRFFDLNIDTDKSAKVLIKDIQVHPISFDLKSVSFYQVDEESKITVQVPISFVGESPAVKQNLGFLINQLDTINVHCLPKDLPTSIEVDISVLKTPGDAITVGQINLGENVELDSSMETTTAIAYVGTAQKEEAKVEVVATPEAAATTPAPTPAAK